MADVSVTAEPRLSDIKAALSRHANPDGTVPAGVATEIVSETGWHGRLVEVLAVLAAHTERMGYLAGGRRPDEVAEWLSVWSESSLTVEQIRLATDTGGWDPDPFVTLAGAGLLESFLHLPDGSARRVKGELAGAWLSDELAMADDEEIVSAVRRVLAD